MSGDLITIYRPDVFEWFRGGEQNATGAVSSDVFFGTCVATQYGLFARGFGCRVKLSATRVEDARRLWLRDVNRIELERRIEPLGGPLGVADEDGIPDHFKQVGFLVYWLRRRCVVDLVERDRPSRGDAPHTPQDRFLLSANEICAFLLGFRICQYFECEPLLTDVNDIAALIRKTNLERHLIYDVATLLRHKNLSPHALYLIYRALFYRLEWAQ